MKIIKEALRFDENLRKRFEFICEFSKVTTTFINGTIRKIYLQKFFGDEYSHSRVKYKILDYENRNIIKYGKKYKWMKENECSQKS